MIISRRHKKLGLRTKVTRKIAEIPVDDWNKVFPDVLESYAFFNTLDESSLEQFSFYYIMVYDRATPVCAVPCFIMDYSLDTTVAGPTKRIMNAIEKCMLNIFSIRALFCGNPLGQGRIGISENPDHMHVLLRRMEQIAKKNKAAIIAFKDFDKTYDNVLGPLQKKGFSKFTNLPWTELDISFKNFEEYLKTLSGATRYDLRRKFKKVDNHVAIDLEVVDTLEDKALEDLYRLYLDIVAKHDLQFEIMSIDFFRNVSKIMPSHAKYFLWRIDGKLVAFLFCLVSEDVMIDYYAGFDYSVAHTYHLYFIKFRDTLNWCIKHGIKKYEMGATGYEPKKRLGLAFIPLYLYVRIRNRALRPISNLMCQFLKFDNFDPNLKKAM